MLPIIGRGVMKKKTSIKLRKFNETYIARIITPPTFGIVIEFWNETRKIVNNHS